jgi:hypothetical protein
MSSGAKWWTRATAAVTGAVLTLLIPAHAWAASNGVADLVVEAAKVRRRGGIGIFGILGGLCCLLVVGGVVLGVLMIARRKRR